MMLNSASKKQQKRLKSPRSPLKLKNLNVTSSSSSSSTCSSSKTATSISSEAPTGCLRFFLSHHSSALSKPNKSNQTLKSRLVKKEVVPSKSSRCHLSSGVHSFASGFHLKLTNDSANVARLTKPSSRYHLSHENGQNLRKPSSRYQLSDENRNNPSGFEVKVSNNAANPSSRYHLSDEMSKFSTGVELNLTDSSEGFTPVNNFRGGSALVSVGRDNKGVKLTENDANASDTCRSPTPPPVQASVSPEIQGGLTSVVAATPSTCYAAGHVLSGVTDKRKCRPKGILTIGNNNLFGSSKTKGLYDVGESIVSDANNRRDSIVPSPTEASVCWLSSPCDEKRSGALDNENAHDDTYGLRLDQYGELLPFKLTGCSSSLSSSLGFSSEVFNKSNSTISISDASSVTPSSRSKSSELLNSDLSSEFRGVLGPSLDHLVCCPSPPFKVEYSPKQDKSECDHENQASSDLEDSLGSGNVMQTPDSNPSPSNFMLSHRSPNSYSRSPDFGLSELSSDPISRLWLECELETVAEALQGVSVSPRPSFEFNPLIKLNNSIDLTLSRKTIDTRTSDTSVSLPNSLPEPDIRISYTESSANRVFGLDELDCCRYLTDEEDNALGLDLAELTLPEQPDSNCHDPGLKLEVDDPTQTTN